ncbi:2-oxo-4-hydroxy-4-carboxy-5-ureidoimidazoline decarboxylase [Ideonella oryzae]|uniref:2-oxo-4-hydroxy-4-carboxy-5-ureidoimidazoline decarboxylase n=1 Tax=Ideonella oryzae TaxID=2937441 RepID=A0ABT1BQK9_9BURK|nr:2-oxo-4-hydroxy-4-carboxy-5-ureidoimidazoline decarboxylase [Ideonella oryzae]MCO5978513.1 2-oxo-4-hydroxy-4-carboxy-5-ureidoimidazoline decarboxylase [Ideonella oryzae]
MPAALTLDLLNRADHDTFCRLLAGVYEHSPWIAEGAWTRRPSDGFTTLAQLKRTLVEVVRAAPEAAQLDLIRAHPELAGKAMVAKTLTAESTGEQRSAGLTDCSPEEFARLQQLNADYNARFGWPFILAVKGPRGAGLTRQQIIDTFARRLSGTKEFEFAECLRNIHRIAEIRLNEKFGAEPVLGNQVWDWAEALAAHSEPGFAERGELTVTYLTPAHQACATQLLQWMREAGFDEVQRDAVGNVVGVYHGGDRHAPRLLTGSHYDTVRNGGKYDGRLGILVTLAAVRELHRQGRRLPFGIELVAFAEEEGQRYKATFLGSGALVGQFDPAWLDQTDAQGIAMREAMRAADLPATLDAIAGLRRSAADYRGYVEVHIEQGPVLDDLDLPLGVVTSINGSARYRGRYTGVASHAGTTPMNRRRDAATAAAELALFAEARASADEGSVATVGMLEVPQGSINVVPGACEFSLDLRAPTNAQRDAMVLDVRRQAQRIAERRRVQLQLEEVMVASAAPSDPAWQRRWEAAVRAQGLSVFHLPSGAGHDAMKLHELLPQAMLFVRGGNAGISHNPLESVSNDDCELAVHALLHLLDHLAPETP